MSRWQILLRGPTVRESENLKNIKQTEKKKKVATVKLKKTGKQKVELKGNIIMLHSPAQ